MLHSQILKFRADEAPEIILNDAVERFLSHNKELIDLKIVSYIGRTCKYEAGYIFIIILYKDM